MKKYTNRTIKKPQWNKKQENIEETKVKEQNNGEFYN